jgi:hypothetical protein
MSDTHTPQFRTGDAATIFYGEEQAIRGTVVKILTSRTGNVRRVGIAPEGAEIVAWFTPVDYQYGLVSVGGSTVAYV